MSSFLNSAKKIFILSKKEVLTYFNSPIAYIVIIFFLVFNSVFFFFIQNFVANDIASLRAYFAIIPSLFIIVIPAITMRSWAEEKKLGTDELLLTMPFREGELVMAKYVGALFLIVVILVLSLGVPLSIAPLGDFEVGQIAGQYLGVLSLASAAIAVGQFMSSVSRNQISAFIFGIVGLLLFSLLGQINILLEPPRLIGAVIDWLSIPFHFRGFEIGLIDTRDLLYYLLLTTIFLYLTTKNIIIKKWR